MYYVISAVVSVVLGYVITSLWVGRNAGSISLHTNLFWWITALVFAALVVVRRLA